MKIITNILVILFALALGGCAENIFFYKPLTIEQQRKESSQTLNLPGGSARDEEVKTLSYNQKVPAGRRSSRQVLISKKLKGVEGPVSINANLMRLPEFVIYVIGETLKIPFVMDQAVMEDNRLVTLSTPRPVSADDALEMIAGALEKYELIVEEKAGALHVMHKPPAPRPTMEIQSGSEINEGSGDVLHILPLKFLKVAEIQTLIADLSRGNIQIKPYSRENVIILHGESSQMKQIIDFINYFDVPSLQAKKVMFLRLTYWQPEEFITQLSKMLEGMGIAAAKTSREPGPVLIAVRQMNAVLAVAPDEITMKYILDWKDRLDTVEAAGSEEKAFTFAPQFSRASDIVDSLLKLYGISPRSENSSGSLSTTYQTTGQGFQIPSTDSQTANRIDISGKQFASGKLNASETGFSAASLPALKIAADNNKNIVIMICSPTVYRQHLDLLRQLDTQTKQVLIEATIAELSLTDELKYGIEWYINNTINERPITGGTFDNLIDKTAGNLGMALNFVSSATSATAKFKAMLNALATKNKANILSTPRLTVLDNHEAVIQIGQDVPVATSEQTTASSTSADPTIQRSIQYRSVGIILKVKPTINTEGLLTLELIQEVSNLADSAGVGDSPIITIRKINTSVVVAHGQTVALGGLMKEHKGVIERKVPLLGDIPLERTELLILVTPTILTKTDDATKITEELKKEIKWMKF